MKIVIAGAGSVGRFMARQIAGSGHDVTIIDQTPAVVSRFSSSTSGLRWHVGDACEVDTLTAAGCEGADVLAAATGDDEIGRAHV